MRGILSPVRACNLFVAAPYFLLFPGMVHFPYWFEFTPISIVKGVEPLRSSLLFRAKSRERYPDSTREAKEITAFCSLRVLGKPSVRQTNRIRLTLYVAKEELALVTKDKVARALKWPIRFYFLWLQKLPETLRDLDFDLIMLEFFKTAIRRRIGLQDFGLEIRSVTLGSTLKLPEGLTFEFP